MEMVLSLDELRRLSGMLLRYHVTGSNEFTCLKPVTHQYK